MSDAQVTALLSHAAALLAARSGGGAGTPARSVPQGELRAGVDLGTASCVLAVLDGAGQPVHVASYPSGALRDGVVVDFAAAERTVRRLREEAGDALGAELTSAATAYPPCIAEPDARACRFVCEAAGFDKVTLTDEVTAAQHTLGIGDGVIVDVGGGSTGVGIFRAGRLVALADRPGGGHHLDLVLAGEVISSYLGRETVSYPHALLITPLGIARCAP